MNGIDFQWEPSLLGRFITGCSKWSLRLHADCLRLIHNNKSQTIPLIEINQISVTPGTFWATICIPYFYNESIKLKGLPNSQAEKLIEIFDESYTSEAIKTFDELIKPVLQWVSKARSACKNQFATKGWLTHEFVQSQAQSKPRGLEAVLSVPKVEAHLTTLSQSIRDDVNFWKEDFSIITDEMNQIHMNHELVANHDFFNNVENSSLTEEQSRAVICFDNRVLLVASAGSGKTSTMVAKTGFALKKGYFAPENILLLAFNKKAADELNRRIKSRLIHLGLPAEKVDSKTFHALGLDIIGNSTGKRPTVAKWVENGQDVEMLLNLVDEIKDTDENFRTNWDLFRVVLSQDLPAFGKEQDSPDSWDTDKKSGGFWTLNGDIVKSRGELLIANWLFYNGVNYEYESPYCIDTADSQHRQYRPDFYFPDIDAYLEHWAINEKGEAPAEFIGYAEGMAWKKLLHQEHGTKLLETTMAGLWNGDAFAYLAKKLTELGLKLDPNPERKGVGRKPIENHRLGRTFRSFLTHFKSNQLTFESLRERLADGDAGKFRYRHHVFIELFEKIFAAWQSKLKSEKSIDFEDMLIMADACIENGDWKNPFDLVMVDEFQDVSNARARLVASLVKGSGKYLFAVGDDWQSINRFAGSDLSVMTEFSSTFGPSVMMKLESTFRCPQSLCDVSSVFIQKNPKQIRKQVKSTKPNISTPITIIKVKDETAIQGVVAQRINQIASQQKSPTAPLEKVFVLGRYRRDIELLPNTSFAPHLKVEFVTVHSSKGLEADHIIIPRMTSETMGFPSRIEDDPVLQLAMPSCDSYADAEERRLLYVALTRAKASVAIITIDHKESPFIVELVQEHNVPVVDITGKVSSSEVCPLCTKGFLVRRKGPYSEFFGCSRFPKCPHKEKIRPASNPN